MLGKIYQLLVLASVVAMAGLIVVPAANGQNTIGIYWDEAFTQQQAMTSAPFEFLTGHIVIMDPTSGGGILAWECEVDIEGPAAVTSWQTEGQGINAASPPRFAVGLAAPLPPAATTQVATFELLVTEVLPVDISLKPFFNASVAGEMSYLGADNPEQLTVMTPVTGEALVATVNANVPIGEVNQTSVSFGEVGLNTSSTQRVQVTNIGTTPLPLNVTLDCADPAFVLSGLAGPVTVDVGHAVFVDVTFTPTLLGSTACLLNLGGYAPAVALRGAGREQTVLWTIPNDIDFGPRVIGSILQRTTSIRNNGEAPLELDVALVGAGPDFSIVSGAGSLTLTSGLTHYVTVQYRPQSLGTHTAHLSFGAIYPEATLTGESFPDEPLYTVTPTNVTFNTVDVGSSSTRTLAVENVGAVTLNLNIGFTSDCLAFSIESGGGPRSIPPGSRANIYLRFTPPSPGSFACVLALGEGYPFVGITGTGYGFEAIITATPAGVNFPITEVGASRTQIVEIKNSGTLAGVINPQMATPSPVFGIAAGTGEYTLQPGTSRYIHVRFTPLAQEQYFGVVDLGDGLVTIPLMGYGGVPLTLCDVSTDLLEFAVANHDPSTTQSVAVANLGNQPIELNPGTSSPEFQVFPEGPHTLEPGQTVHYQVIFTASLPGLATATLVLGPAVCSTVALQGTLDYGFEPGENLVGLFFDPSYQAIETGIASGTTTIPVYLALINPSDPSGVGGWECRISATGGAEFVDWDLAGNAINAANPYDSSEFTVGIGLDPLPYAAEGVLLATFSLLVYDPEPGNVTLELHPKRTPSIPGLMAWVPWSNTNQLIPMLPFTGQPMVAWINPAAPVALETPTPLATQVNGQVDLQWPMQALSGDRYHVYRQDPTNHEVRLTNEPIPATTNTIRFSDQPDFPGGTILRYSYALVRNGVDIARSPSVEVTVTSLPVVKTQLLANVPNPFNPQTQIRFQLSGAGHARVTIYDVTGRRVRTLVDEQRNAGENTIIWQGRDDAGRQVASGAYYVRLETDGGLDHRKIMMLK